MLPYSNDNVWLAALFLTLLVFLYLSLSPWFFKKRMFITFKIRKRSIANEKIWLKMDHKEIMLT